MKETVRIKRLHNRLPLSWGDTALPVVHGRGHYGASPPFAFACFRFFFLPSVFGD